MTSNTCDNKTTADTRLFLESNVQLDSCPAVRWQGAKSAHSTAILVMSDAVSGPLGGKQTNSTFEKQSMYQVWAPHRKEKLTDKLLDRVCSQIISCEIDRAILGASIGG